MDLISFEQWTSTTTAGRAGRTHPKLTALDAALRKYHQTPVAPEFWALHDALQAFKDVARGDDTHQELTWDLDTPIAALDKQVEAIGKEYPVRPHEGSLANRGGLLAQIQGFDRGKLKKGPTPEEWKAQRHAPVLLPDRVRYERFEGDELRKARAAWTVAAQWSVEASAAIHKIATSKYELERFRHFFNAKPPTSAKLLKEVQEKILAIGAAFGGSGLMRGRNVTLVNFKGMSLHPVNGVAPAIPGQERPTGDKFSGLAYVVRNVPDTQAGGWRIYLAAGFFQGGAKTQAKYVYHEMSHKAALTIDHKYGLAECEKLARDAPKTAIENADNFTYYAMSLIGPPPASDTAKYAAPEMGTLV
jgi:hypothetical protein